MIGDSAKVLTSMCYQEMRRALGTIAPERLTPTCRDEELCDLLKSVVSETTWMTARAMLQEIEI